MKKLTYVSNAMHDSMAEREVAQYDEYWMGDVYAHGVLEDVLGHDLIGSLRDPATLDMNETYVLEIYHIDSEGREVQYQAYLTTYEHHDRLRGLAYFITDLATVNYVAGKVTDSLAGRVE